MEKERFESMHKTFNYTPKSAFTNQWSNMAYGIGMIVVPLLLSLKVRTQWFHLQAASVLFTIFIVAGILLLLMTYFNMKKASALAAQGGKITIDGKRVSYPVVRNNKVEYDTFLISDIRSIKDDEEENQCKIDLPDKYIVFEIKYFDSDEQFDEFRELME